MARDRCELGAAQKEQGINLPSVSLSAAAPTLKFGMKYATKSSPQNPNFQSALNRSWE